MLQKTSWKKITLDLEPWIAVAVLSVAYFVAICGAGTFAFALWSTGRGSGGGQKEVSGFTREELQ
jgi:hypothetical protein